METLYDKASLILNPGIYDTGEVYCTKPLDGSGDLTFTRASNASRVGPDGLLEKVRTNILRQSNSFDTTWGTSGSSVTSGQSGYDGTSNAWKLERVGAAGLAYVYQTLNATGIHSYSVYAKANTNSWILLQDTSSGGASGYFDLENGVAGSVSALSHSITSVGDGWYRITVVGNRTTNDYIRIFVASANGNLTVSGSIFIQNSQFETGDIATEYIPTTTSARSTFAGITVDGTSVPNVPRLDYTDSTCPKLLLEPSRTNSVFPSEDFSNYLGVGSTVVTNAAVSPNGYQNADKIIATTSTLQHNRYTTFTYTGASSYSVYLKAAGYNYAQMYGGGSAPNRFSVVINLTNGTIDTYDNISESQIEITAMGNGWYRLAVNNFNASANFIAVAPIPSAGMARNASYDILYTGDNTSGIFAWGIQVEQNASYSTSYISTQNAAVTRVIDRFSKTGLGSVINSQEGTLFVEMATFSTNMGTTLFSLSDGSPNNNIYIGYTATTNQISSVLASGGVARAVFNTFAFNVTQPNKIAISYKEDEVTMYVNGTLIGTDTSAIMPAAGTLTQLKSDFGQGSFPLAASISQLLIFPTALTNAQMAELTTL
jgi:hypothetical protein